MNSVEQAKDTDHRRSQILPVDLDDITMADAPSNPRSLMSRPKDQEYHYFGLYSRPKLVAQSSTKLWSWQYDEPWNDSQRSLWRQILQAVQELKWTAIDVLRIGYERNNDRIEEKFDHPVTLLISVKIGSNIFEKAYEVVAACRQILESHELNDVQVEIKESEVARATSMPLPTPDLPAPDPATPSSATPGLATLKLSSGPLEEPVAMSADFSEFLGVSIASSAAPLASCLLLCPCISLCGVGIGREPWSRHL